MEESLKHYADKLAYEIDSWDLQAALNAGERLIVIDARSAEAYAAGHIPGAISLPHRGMSEATTAGLDRTAQVVTYCDGIGCNASTKGALNMARLGFRVKELIGGLDWWQRDGHPVEGSASGREGGETCRSIITMNPAYLVGQITVKDPAKWAEYRSRVPATLAPWGAELVFRGRQVAVLEGGNPHTDIVVIRFPGRAALDGWHASAAYRILIPLRREAAEMALFAYES